MRYKSPEMMEKIIRFVDEYYMVHQKSPSMAMIADEVGLHRSNVQRYLVEMTENGMLKQEGRKIVTPAIEKNSKPVLAAHVGSIRCGTPEFEEQDIDAYFTLPEAIFGKGEYYILTAKGDSMIEAGIEEGDWVVVRKIQEAESGDIIVALLNGENTLKRYQKDKNGQVYLHPENSTMDDIPVREDDEFYLQGVATHIIKKIASSIDRLR